MSHEDLVRQTFGNAAPAREREVSPRTRLLLAITALATTVAGYAGLHYGLAPLRQMQSHNLQMHNEQIQQQQNQQIQLNQQNTGRE